MQELELGVKLWEEIEKELNKREGEEAKERRTDKEKERGENF